jgi:hypothetical protein
MKTSMHAAHSRSTEAARHQATIETLARETRTEPVYVRQLFERELAALTAQAKVHGYLLVLASRNVRAALAKARTSH